MRMRSSILLFVVFLVTACGFRLAGSRPLPAGLQSVYIETQLPYTVDEPPLEIALRSRLRRRGADVTGSAGAAETVLRLSQLQEAREVLSVGPDGKALEFKLTTRVTYLLLQDGKALVPPYTQTVTRDYSFNAQQVLAKEAEEARLRRFIQDELAELVLLRLETLLANQSRTAVGAAQPEPAPAR